MDFLASAVVDKGVAAHVNREIKDQLSFKMGMFSLSSGLERLVVTDNGTEALSSCPMQNKGEFLYQFL